MEYIVKVTTPENGEHSCVFEDLDDALSFLRLRCKSRGTTASLEIR